MNGIRTRFLHNSQVKNKFGCRIPKMMISVWIITLRWRWVETMKKNSYQVTLKICVTNYQTHTFKKDFVKIRLLEPWNRLPFQENHHVFYQKYQIKGINWETWRGIKARKNTYKRWNRNVVVDHKRWSVIFCTSLTKPILVVWRWICRHKRRGFHLWKNDLGKWICKNGEREMRREEEDGERKERLKIVREVAKIGCVVFWKRCPIWGDDGIGRVGG